jgi:2-octaprenyl-6-methoxyphenol hydroxylase
MAEINYNVVVSGAGPAGLAAAILLAIDGVKTALVAPQQFGDVRTTALMHPSIQLLKFCGVWTDDLKTHCAPLKQLHVIDDTGNYITAPPLAFRADELQLEEFGWNVPLAVLVPALRRRAGEVGVTIIEDSSETAISFEDHIELTLHSGQKLDANICIAADGAQSNIRKALGFTTENWAFDQSALATSFAHSAPHQNVSTEFHKQAGPFTTVPLPNNFSSLVWMDKPNRIEHLNTLSDAELAIEIQLETKGILGRVSNIGARKIFPMKGQRATLFAANRCIILGEAAHVLPPIGAQGLNLSLRDAAHAADVIIGAGDAGATSILAEYNNVRQRDVVPRQQMVNLLNTSLLSNMPFWPLARSTGLKAISGFGPLRNFAMQQGLAPAANLPFAMR